MLVIVAQPGFSRTGETSRDRSDLGRGSGESIQTTTVDIWLVGAEADLGPQGGSDLSLLRGREPAFGG